jgi:hypothetical protein
MNARVIALATLFAAFAVLTAEAFVQMGFVGFFAALAANLATVQVFTDLVIGLSVVLGFIWYDARERGLPFARYAVATVLLGSFGPLAYLIHRELASRSEVAGAARPNHARAV